MTDTTPNHHDHDDVAAVAPAAVDADAAVDSNSADGLEVDVVDEAADFVHPVDHGRGTEELPLEAEPAGSYVSGGAHDLAADGAIDDDEKGDYVTPVDHGHGTTVDVDGESGDYVEPVDRG